MSTQQAPTTVDRTSLAGCEARLRMVFSPDTIVWITDEQYEANGPTWRVTMVHQSEQGMWRRRRYRYDIPSNTLHFTGETTVSDSELAVARSTGRRL
jgi:hypothetical protein